MKKLLSFGMAIALAGVASAVTMQWNANSVAFDGTKFNKTTGATVTGYLVALDAFAASYDVTDSFVVSDIGTQVDTKTGTSAVGKLQGNWTIDTETYGNGDTFAVLLKYTSAADSKTYWNLSSGLLAMAAMDDGSGDNPPSDANAVTATFSFGTAATEGKLTAGGGWTAAAAVPEPGTAALALLGVGMLLKRRRA